MKWMIVTSNINGPLSAAILSTSCEFTHLTLSNLGGRYTPVLTEEDIDTERVRNQPNVTQLGHKPRQPGCGAIISPHPLLFAPALEGPRVFPASEAPTAAATRASTEFCPLLMKFNPHECLHNLLNNLPTGSCFLICPEHAGVLSVGRIEHPT